MAIWCTGKGLYSPLRLRIAALRLMNNETRCGAPLKGFGLRVALGYGGGRAGTMPVASGPVFAVGVFVACR